MPRVGDRQRAVAVVGLVTAMLLLVAFVPSTTPALAQGTPMPTTTTPAERSSTTVAIITTTTLSGASTTVAPATTTSTGPGPTTTRARGASSPSSTTAPRRSSPSTTTARTATTAEVDDSPSTTERDSLFPNISRPPRTTTSTSSPSLKQAAASTGLSTGNLVTLVIAGLLTVVLALSALTVRYVRATRPGDRYLE